LHGKIAPFAGFEMPIEYSGILAEHRAVRSAMGLFDLSHMGEFIVTGSDALSSVDRIVTNRVSDLAPGEIRYTPMCLDDGGIIDDLLVYRFADRVMLVVNASNIDKDFAWITGRLDGNATCRNASDEYSLIAVQGPSAAELVQSVTEGDVMSVRYYNFVEGSILGIPAIVSRTGYTGEDGFELYVENAEAPRVFDLLLQKGTPNGLVPAGLGARDTLRLEACLPLYGNDIDQTTNPIEAGLGWTVKLDGRSFIGGDALLAVKDGILARKLVAFKMQDRAIARAGARVYVDGDSIGTVTSGSFSPSFSIGVGMAYVDSAHAAAGTDVSIEVREQLHPATVVNKPFYRRTK
jgi:aminomethyltransferase